MSAETTRERQPTRHAAIVVLSQLGDHDLDFPRITPSTWEEAFVRLLTVSDSNNLLRLRSVHPALVDAYLVYARQPGGVQQLVRLANDDTAAWS